MKSDNYIQIAGRLTADVEPNSTSDYARFTLAVNFGTGEEARSLFLRCAVYGKEFRNNGQKIPWDILTKGAPVLVTGRIRPDIWKDRTGTVRRDIEIVCDKIRCQDR